MSGSITIKQKLSQFISLQQSVGISLQTFKQKFVFNLNSGPDAIYLDPNSQSPSQLHNISKIQQKSCILLMSQMIFKAGQMLKLPISTTIVALNISQYYFTRKSLLDYDFRDISMGAMFLACKSEETLRRSYQIAAVFDYIFKMYEGIRGIRQLQLNSPQYNYMKQKVTKTQNQILFQLGFEVYKLFDIPHRYISGLITSFNRHKQCNAIVQHSWTFLNDIYRTKAAVSYPGQIIAAASVFMALQKLNIALPEKPWWILMEASIQQIRHICLLTNQMYELTNKIQVDINKISNFLQKAGKLAIKVTNVLPVPYYRKIRLQNQGLYMKAIQEQIPKIIEKKQTKRYQSQENDNNSQNHREKSKKQKKKHKKKQKSHRNEDRSKSKSQQKRKTLQKGKYQNDDETPKIRKLQQKIICQITTQNKNIQQIMTKIQQKQTNNAHIQSFKIVEQISQRKNSDNNVINGSREPTFAKKSALFDAKSMLSKISQQIKKIEVKNEMTTVLNQKNLEISTQLRNLDRQNEKHKDQINEKLQKEPKGDQLQDNISSSDEEDQLLAELIQIKKKNLQKKEQNN